MTGMLASVTDDLECEMAITAGVDIIDLKDPANGALGALPPHRISSIVSQLAGRRPVSATLGDLPADLSGAYLTGVDFHFPWYRTLAPGESVVVVADFRRIPCCLPLDDQLAQVQRFGQGFFPVLAGDADQGFRVSRGSYDPTGKGSRPFRRPHLHPAFRGGVALYGAAAALPPYRPGCGLLG